VGIELYLAFVIAATILVVIPGPTVMLVVSYGLTQGRRSVLWAAPGVGLGDAVALTVSALGLGALLAASAELFTLVKWAGAAYLLYLGVKLWREPVPAPPPQPGQIAPAVRQSGARLFWHAFAVTALNPKGMVFFAAFLPQFMVPGAPLLPQYLLLGATFVVIAVLNVLAYGFLASGMQLGLHSPRAARACNRLGGSILIGAGLLLATRRPG
jgi:homoserine/homoserine lactone efflux protein